MTPLVGAERDPGSRAGHTVAAETVGIRGAHLKFLPTGQVALFSDAKNPPDPDEVHALLLEFIPPDWCLCDEEAGEDFDVSRYGPEESTHAPVPLPRAAG